LYRNPWLLAALLLALAAMGSDVEDGEIVGDVNDDYKNYVQPDEPGTCANQRKTLHVAHPGLLPALDRLQHLKWDERDDHLLAEAVAIEKKKAKKEKKKKKKQSATAADAAAASGQGAYLNVYGRNVSMIPNACYSLSNHWTGHTVLPSAAHCVQLCLPAANKCACSPSRMLSSRQHTRFISEMCSSWCCGSWVMLFPLAGYSSRSVQALGGVGQIYHPKVEAFQLCMSQYHAVSVCRQHESLQAICCFHHMSPGQSKYHDPVGAAAMGLSGSWYGGVAVDDLAPNCRVLLQNKPLIPAVVLVLANGLTQQLLQDHQVPTRWQESPVQPTSCMNAQQSPAEICQ
jgi:hypothetical protein